MQAIAGVEDVKFEKDDSKIESIGREVDEAYIQEVLNLTLSPEVIQKQHTLKIVFSPIHGTGITLIPEVLKRKGFESVTVVEEQAIPDGNFPTVVYPNPEEREAMSLALQKADQIHADLVMATDPDSDRVGIAARNKAGEYEILNGNQAASLLIYYLLTKWKENGKLNGNQMIVKTIVTTDLLDKIATSFGVECPNTLTGFKYIAALIKEEEGKKEFIGGSEESYGYMISDFVRDKDAVASCAMLAEMCAWAKDQGLSVFQLLARIYQEYGFYQEDLISITKKGMKGAEEIQEMMANFRSNPPKTLAGAEVVKLLDYQTSVAKDLKEGTEEAIDLPKSNVLQFVLEDGAKISARPSGTEPKIKFYISVNQPLANEVDYDKVKSDLHARIEQIRKELEL